MRRGCYIFSGSLFIRRQIPRQYRRLRSSLRACMDFDLLLRLGATDRSTHLQGTIGQLRMHDSNKSSSIKRVFLAEGFPRSRRYAGRSPRLWLVAIRSAASSALMLATTRLRYSSRWPAMGGARRCDDGDHEPPWAASGARLRILHVAPWLAPRYGGPAVSTPKIAAALCALGHDVEIRCDRCHGSESC